jgi:solute carrier family 35 protein C2
MVATETHFVLSGLLLVLSASACGGLRWGLSQLLLKDKKMGMDNPAATIYWLSPIMGLSLAIISLVLDGWIKVFTTPFFDGFWATLNTSLYLLAPGIVAFCMLMSEF